MGQSHQEETLHSQAHTMLPGHTAEMLRHVTPMKIPTLALLPTYVCLILKLPGPPSCQSLALAQDVQQPQVALCWPRKQRGTTGEGKRPWWGDRHRAGGSLEELRGVGWQDGAAGVPSACLW